MFLQHCIACSGVVMPTQSSNIARESGGKDDNSDHPSWIPHRNIAITVEVPRSLTRSMGRCATTGLINRAER